MALTFVATSFSQRCGHNSPELALEVCAYRHSTTYQDKCKRCSWPTPIRSRVLQKVVEITIVLKAWTVTASYKVADAAIPCDRQAATTSKLPEGSGVRHELKRDSRAKI